MQAQGAAQQIQRYVSEHADHGPDLLPSVLARACAEALHVNDAGLSMIEGRFRMPIGASSDMASYAESLQFTLGIGPCLESASRGEPITAPMAELERRWPELARELSAGTPYQAIVSLPMSLRAATGAIDLYLEDDAALRAVSLADAIDASAAVTAILQADAAFVASLRAEAEDGGPSFLDREPARSRGQVWIAIGILMARTSEPSRDALARLRAYAYAADASLDAVAAALVAGTLDAELVLQ